MRTKPTTTATLEAAARWVQLPLHAPIDEVFGPAHNIKLDAERSAKGMGCLWGQDPWPPFDTIRAHVDQGGLFGSVPNSFVLSDGLHLSALDVDRGNASVLTSIYPPLVAIPSWQAGRVHAYYPDTELRPNPEWSLGDVGGEVRGTGGYLAHYRTGPLELAEAVHQYPHGPPCVPFPEHLCRFTSRRKEKLGRSPSSASRGSLSGRAYIAIGPPAGLTPLLRFRDVAIGHRHPTMVHAAARWAGRKTWNGRALSDDWLIRHLWRLAIGIKALPRLPEDEVAGIVGWAVSMRPIFQTMANASQWLATQASRGRAGGLASGVSRRKGTPIENDRKPWESLGISRATWYRHARE